MSYFGHLATIIISQCSGIALINVGAKEVGADFISESSVTLTSGRGEIWFVAASNKIL
jgi:hypothetical protein